MSYLKFKPIGEEVQHYWVIDQKKSPSLKQIEFHDVAGSLEGGLGGCVFKTAIAYVGAAIFVLMVSLEDAITPGRWIYAVAACCVAFTYVDVLQTVKKYQKVERALRDRTIWVPESSYSACALGIPFDEIEEPQKNTVLEYFRLTVEYDELLNRPESHDEPEKREALINALDSLAQKYRDKMAFDMRVHSDVQRIENTMAQNSRIFDKVLAQEKRVKFRTEADHIINTTITTPPLT